MTNISYFSQEIFLNIRRNLATHGWVKVSGTLKSTFVPHTGLHMFLLSFDLHSCLYLACDMFILGCISSSSTCLCGQTWSGCRVRLEVMDGEALCWLGLCWRQLVCSHFQALLTHSSKVEHYTHLRNLHVPCRPVTSAIKKGFHSIYLRLYSSLSRFTLARTL